MLFMYRYIADAAYIVGFALPKILVGSMQHYWIISSYLVKPSDNNEERLA